MLEHLSVKTFQKLIFSQIFTNTGSAHGFLTKANKTVQLPVKLFTKTRIRCLNMEEPCALR